MSSVCNICSDIQISNAELHGSLLISHNLHFQFYAVYIPSTTPPESRVSPGEELATVPIFIFRHCTQISPEEWKRAPNIIPKWHWLHL